jgi:hypothetical protein
MSIGAFFVPLRIVSAFLLFFLWLFLPHKYNRIVSLAIVSASYLLTGLLEVTISRHVAQSIDFDGIEALIAEVLVVLCTAVLLGEHRDSRSIFVGMSACACALAAFVFGSLVYCYMRNILLSLVGQAGFNIIVLVILYKNNRKTPLTELLADKTGRAKLCLIPFVCFVSIFISSIWPGNIYMIPACRPVSVVMIVLMFFYYQLVMALLRTQMTSSWLKSNNEILNAYAGGLKQQIERTEKEQEELSILRHDIRHRANLVQYYLSEGNTDAVKKMCSEVNAKLDETTERRYCVDSALNWVLSSAAKKAADRGIQFTCSADIPSLPGAIEMEYGTVVLNLLENACNAAARFPDKEKRFIKFSVQRVKGQVFLRIDNSYSGTLRFSPVTKLPISDKGENHGYGLRSVLAFAQIHQATFECTAEKDIFHTRLLIPLPKGF